MRTLKTRDYLPQDAPAALSVFRAAVRISGRRFYTPTQLQTWLSTTPRLRAFDARLNGSLACRVADDRYGVYGFANITRAGHVDFVMCHPRRARQGVGRALLVELIAAAQAHGLTTLTAQASLAARPMFEACAFVVDEPREVMGLPCFGMICHLTD